jgi:hypothetical protein
MIRCGGTLFMFGPRCEAAATYRTPSAPLCDACADKAMGAIRAGETLLNILAESRGISKETLLSKFVRMS